MDETGEEELDFGLAEGFLDFDGLLGKEFSHLVCLKKPFQPAIQRPFPVFIHLFPAYSIRKTFILYFLHRSNTILRCSTFEVSNRIRQY